MSIPFFTANSQNLEKKYVYIMYNTNKLYEYDLGVNVHTDMYD